MVTSYHKYTLMMAVNAYNIYSYTIWPNKESTKECKLFIGLSEMPEMFYVEIKSCPMGFTLKSSIKACYCNPLLNNDKVSITSCNINGGTILRPANSWIFAETVNILHSYDVSLQCPFDYCLPHPSHLNLSDPDSQCQFNRTGHGVLCGECKQGLSTVFGLSWCKHYSNLCVYNYTNSYCWYYVSDNAFHFQPYCYQWNY